MARDIAQEVTDRIVAELAKGIVPWRKPWTVKGLFPTSLQTGKAYRGINALLLSFEAQVKGYGQNLWATYKQANALGGSVKKGEKGTHVVFWRITPDTVDASGEITQKGFPMLREFVVFNVAQCENLTIPPRFEAPVRTWSDSEALDRIVAGYANAPAIKHAASEGAFYVPATDSITLPPKDSFGSLTGYADTLLHELTHSTGHASRLNRFDDNNQPARFGSPVYAKEELVAEIGSMMLMGHAGLEPDTENTAAYIGSWLKALQNDKRLIISAAQQASKAVALITGQKDGE